VKNRLSFLALSLLVIGVMLLWQKKPELLDPLSPSRAQPERFPYAVLHDAHTRHFNTQGILSYEFDAASIKHFRAKPNRSSRDDHMLITAPRFTVYGETEPWHISAKEGRISEQGRKVELWNDVRVWQNPAAANPRSHLLAGTELVTESLVIYPDEKRLSTQDPVRLTGPSTQLSAEGLEVDMIRERIRLFSKVRAQHDPSPPSH
jgi:lipopolysaccharide export system protein LptC